MERHVEVMSDISGFEPAPVAAQFFGNAGREHMELYGTKPEHFAKVAYKNHKHSVNNPKAQFQRVKTLPNPAEESKILLWITYILNFVVSLLILLSLSRSNDANFYTSLTLFQFASLISSFL